jgi:peptide chain release factor 2
MLPDLNTIKELKTKLEKKIENLLDYLDLEKNKIKVKELEELSAENGFWDNKDNAHKVMKKTSDIKGEIEKAQKLITSFDDAQLLITMSIEEKDDEGLNDGWEELLEVEKFVHKTELEMTLSGKLDHLNALLAINAGAGGVDAMDWAEMLQRMYLRWCSQNKFKVKIIDFQAGTEAGIASCTLLIEGKYSYGYLKGESGVHRLVRISPFDSNSRRHTGFASVLVYPDLDDSIDVEINDEDLRVDVYRASGAGGQHVNKTESAVRLTHLPTGLVSACQNERSQHQNKATAMRMLKSRLYQIKQKEQEERMENIVGAKQRIDFGSQIRSYVLAPYRLVTDHRTELKIGNIEAVLDGNIDPFINEYLMKFSKKNR